MLNIEHQIMNNEVKPASFIIQCSSFSLILSPAASLQNQVTPLLLH